MKTAIIYASQHGTTARCAAMLADLIPDTVALPAAEATSITAYDQIILGTAIYAGRGMSAMTQWCTTHLGELQDRRIGLFICCMNDNDATVQHQLDKAFPPELQRRAVVRMSFGGALNLNKLTLPEKAMLRVLGYSQDQDTVDMATIRTFANTFTA